MRRGFKLFIVIFCFQVFTFSALGQDSYHFEQITVKDGLLSNRVRVIHRDHIGYLWIGTNEGLHKYDGEHMRSYIFGKDEENGLKGNLTNFIFEDSLLNLWVGTNAGLALYDRSKDKFIQAPEAALNKGFFSFCLHSDCIVFGDEQGLHLYYPKTGSIEKVITSGEGPWGDYFKVASLDDHTLILASRAGLWRYNVDSQKATLIENFKIQGAISLMIDKNGVIWVGNTQEGIKRFNQHGIVQERLGIQEVIDPQVHFVQDVVEREGKIWISTDGSGIFIYDPTTNGVQNIRHQQGVTNSLATNSILDLYVDDYGNVLTGSVRAGLISINEVFIQSFTEHLPGNPHGLSHPTVLVIDEDNSGKIWIGTDGGGLSSFDPVTESFDHVEAFNTQKVVSVCGYGTHKLLVSFYRGPVRLFDTQRKRFEPSDRHPWLSELSEPESVNPVILKSDQRGNIWKFGARLMVLKADGTIERVTPDKGWNGKLESKLSAFVELNDDEILFGGMNGVYRVNVANQTSQNVLSLWEDDWVGNKSFRYVFSMVRMEDTVWMVSSIGLFSYNYQTGEVKQYKNDQFRSAYGIEVANDSSLWIGAGNGLYRFFPEQDNFQLFGRSDGVRHYEYVNRAAFKSSNGDVYFGAVDGLVRIKSNSNKGLEKEEITLSFDHFRSDGVAIVENTESQLKEGELKLPWDNTSLQMSMVVSEKNFFRKRLFRYVIEGYSDEVIETTNSQLTLSHLPAGKFTLKVFCNRADGSWTDEPASLSIFVPRPWWKQWWFFTCIVVLMVLLFILIRHYLLKQSELMIELELERERKEQGKRLNEQKLEFFTNISHELRTPLSLIYGPLKRLIDEKAFAGDKKGPQIQLMYRQAGKMKRLVDQVLDIRKMDAGKQEVVLTRMNLKEWLSKFLAQYELEFQNKALNLVTNFQETDNFSCDVDKLDKILSNLVINAIKYSPQGGQIFFEQRVEKDRVIFSVGDEGPGVRESEIERLFDRFYQAEDHKAGSGVGLAFAQSLVKQQKGDIWMKNRPQGGAQFEFFLPLIVTEVLKEENSSELVAFQDDVIEERNGDLDYSLLNDKTILIVEDDHDLRQFIVDGLNPHCKVIDAKNGKEAWHLALSKVPDIIVSDVMMPVMDGFELCGKIKKEVQVSHIPVLLLTARSDGESRMQGYKAGADAYLSKPFSLNILCVRMINIFTNREVQKELFKTGADHSLKAVTYSNPDEAFLKKVIAIIHEHMEDPDFDVNQLTAKVAMSRSAFYAKIKAITGQGVNDFIKQLKINKAADLLKETQLSIGEIADKIGYDNQRYFSTVFKDLKKVTPSQFRQLEK